MTDTLAKILTLPVTPPHTHRDRWGKPIIITGQMRSDGRTPRATTCIACNKPVEGVPYRRVTSYIDVLYDKYRLTQWKLRQVARGLAMRNALLVAVAAAGDDDRAVDRLVSDALDAAGTSDAATLGTAVHQFTEVLDRGGAPAIPPSVRPDVDAYVKATRDMTMIECETFVVDDVRGVAGTFDRLVEVDGVRYIADIKTGASIDYETGKIAMQLAMYASGQRYDPATGERTPLGVDGDYGLIIHVPAGTASCELVWVDLAMARQGLEIVTNVWQWRDIDQSSFRTKAPGPALLELIGIAGTVKSLRDLWEAHQHMWTDELTAAATRRRDELEARS